MDEIVSFVAGHTDNANASMGRPTGAQIEGVLRRAEPVKLENQNAFKFELNGVRVNCKQRHAMEKHRILPGKVTAQVTGESNLGEEVFGPGEVVQLRAVMVRIAPEAISSLYDLLLGWREHVNKLISDLSRDVNDHSVWGAHDLVAALVIRDHVEEGSKFLDGPLRGMVDRFVAKIDKDFEHFTELDGQGSLRRVDGRNVLPDSWWWRRVPASGPVHEELMCYYGHSHRNG